MNCNFLAFQQYVIYTGITKPTCSITVCPGSTLVLSSCFTNCARLTGVALFWTRLQLERQHDIFNELSRLSLTTELYYGHFRYNLYLSQRTNKAFNLRMISSSSYLEKYYCWKRLAPCNIFQESVGIFNSNIVHYVYLQPSWAACHRINLCRSG